MGNKNNAVVAVTGSAVGSRIKQDNTAQGNGAIGNDAQQFLNANTSYRGQAVNNYDGRMSIEIIQVGDENEALQRTTPSFGTFGIGKMWIDQTGNGNYGSQHSKGGTYSVMTIKQVGNNNGNAVAADVTDTGFSSPLALGFEAGNDAYTQYQNGNRSTATIDILGEGNKTTQAQQYSVWSLSGQNTATIGIVGNLNAAIQGQLGEYNESVVFITGYENVVTTSQLGDSNNARVDVVNFSSDNVGAIVQTGREHNATIWQSGDGNFGTITSDGNGHFGEIIQNGGLNQAVITQQN